MLEPKQIHLQIEMIFYTHNHMLIFQLLLKITVMVSLSQNNFDLFSRHKSNDLPFAIVLLPYSQAYLSAMSQIDLIETRYPKLNITFFPLDFSPSILAFIMVLLEDVEDMEDSLGVDCGINKSEVESPGMILIKGFVEVKICPPLDKTN